MKMLLISMMLGQFDIAQDEFAVQAAADRSPAPYRTLIDLMASNRCVLRDAAQVELDRRFNARPEDTRYLLYGLLHRDPEIRMRCGAMTLARYRCVSCLGAGRIIYTYGWTSHENQCITCKGRGLDYDHAPWLSFIPL